MKICALLFLMSLLFGGVCVGEEPFPRLQVIPVPKEIHFVQGQFAFNSDTRIVAAATDKTAGLLDDYIFEVTGHLSTRGAVKPERNYVRLLVDSTLGHIPGEGYLLTITPDYIDLLASDQAGAFYGVQTLIQLLADGQFWYPEKKQWELPCLRIEDEPSFAYRGLHLDVSRHFLPVSFIEKTIGLMSSYKLNKLHLHLTDAAGWRIEIKKYPALTDTAAWRSQEDWKTWWRGGRRYATATTPNAYGGYYTQDEIRQIVARASEHFITVIPEIEMPGHSEEVLAVYPQLSCTGLPYRNGELCVGNEATFKFIEDILTEVLELFPSEYIHIGGDETSRNAWKKCLKCKKRMETERLNNLEELHSYFVNRVGKILKSKGRKMIGWDEILQGKLTAEATVMSWRGEKGGIEAAKSGRQVIMTPGEYCYFDFYQADPVTQPYAIGGHTPYLKVYSYHPVPAALSEEEGRRVWGAQGNVWSEYMHEDKHVEYMIYPRLLALSEVVWSPRERKDADDFKYRVGKHIGLLQQKGVNVFTLSDRVEMLTETDTANGWIKVTLDAEKYDPTIRYTLDGSEPQVNSTLYTGPFYIRDSAKISAALFDGATRRQYISRTRQDFHKAIGKSVKYTKNYNNTYPAAGKTTLTDGYRGGLTYSDGRWQGFLTHIDVTVDLGKVMDLNYVSAGFLQLTGPGVYMPEYVEVSVSEDGKIFHQVARVTNDIPKDKPDLFLKDFSASFQAKGRYVRLFARKQSGFTFIDEIVIY